MTFRDQQLNDFNTVIANTGEAAEQITYTPKGGAAKQINAFVERDRIQPGAQSPAHTPYRQIVVYVANDADSGVTAVNTAGDLVTLAEHYGGATKQMRVAEILHKHHAYWKLALR